MLLPNSTSSLRVNGKLEELLATICRYAIRSAIGMSSCTSESVICLLLLEVC